MSEGEPDPNVVAPWPPLREALRATRILAGRRALSWLAIGNVASVVLAALEIGVAGILQLLLQSLGLLDVSATKGVRFVPTNAELLGLLFLVGVVRLFCQYGVAQSVMVVQESIVARLRRFAIYEMLFVHDRGPARAATVQARVGDTALKSSHFAYYVSNALVQGLQAGCVLVVMFVAAPRESVVAVLGLGVVGVVSLKLGRRAQQMVAKVPAQLVALTEGIERVARNATLVRVLRTEREEHRRLAGAIDRYEDYHVRGASFGAWAGALTPFLGLLLVLVVLALARGVFETPALLLVSFLYLLMRFVQFLAAAVSLLGMANQVTPQYRASLAYVASARVADLEAAVASTPEAAEKKPLVAREHGAAPAVVAEKLTYRYPGATRDAIADVSLDIPAGAQVGIVGSSGTGKSTLLALLLGVLDPRAGKVTFGGVPPAEYFLREDVRVGYVGAESFLVAGTIRDNLLYGARIERSDEDLALALAKARMTEVVEGLPGKLDYGIEEGGTGLSAGQRQRLCLARALLSEPHVLILDEASANLDEGTESEIAAVLADLVGETTVVIVSHRKGILAHVTHRLDLGVAS